MLKISTRTRYGLRLLLDLASCGEGFQAGIEEIAGRQDVSKEYLTQIVQDLRNGGLVRSIRGRNGGIALAHPPERIRISDVVQILEGPISVVDCLADAGICERSPRCPARPVWLGLKEAVEKSLSRWTLAGLIKKNGRAVGAPKRISTGRSREKRR